MVQYLMQKPRQVPMLGRVFFELEKSFQWVQDGRWEMEVRFESLKIDGCPLRGVEKLYPLV